MTEAARPTVVLDSSVTVTRPDDLLVPLCDDQPDVFLAVIERQATAWRNRPVTELIDAFQRAGTPALAGRLRTLMA